VGEIKDESFDYHQQPVRKTFYVIQ